MSFIENGMEWTKKHPIIVVGGLGVIVLFFLLSSSGSGGGSSAGGSSTNQYDAQIADANIAAGTQLQLSQMQLQGQANQISGALQAANLNASTQITLANIGAQVQNYQTEQAANVSMAGINAQAGVQQAGIQSQEVIALAADATQQNIAQISSNTDIARINAVQAISNAPYDAMTALYGDLASGGTDSQGRNGLVQLLYGAEGTKGSVLNLPGLSAGRVGSGGGQILGSSFGASANPFGTVAQGVSAGAQLAALI